MQRFLVEDCKRANVILFQQVPTPELEAQYVDVVFFFSSRRRHTRYWRDWSSDVCSSDLPLEQAISIFSYVDPDAAKRRPSVDSGSGKELATVETIDPWARVTEELSPSEMQTLDEELRYLVNCALVAEGAEPGDPEAIRRVTQMVRSTLRLGLEFLGARLGELAPKYIFQVGFSLGVRL